MFGGAYLAFEGAEKIHHRFSAHSEEGDAAADLEMTATESGPELEEKTVKSAVRTDFILSAEIMVIALKEVIDEGFVSRAIIMAIVAVAITLLVYGVVALIVKMDDVGLSLAQRSGSVSQKVGRGLVNAMPKLLTVLSTVGIAAMIWVGGHILLVGTDELGWHSPYEFVHSLEEPAGNVAGIGGVLSWSVNTLASALIGLAVGFLIVAVVTKVKGAQADNATAVH